ncbi:MAG: GNAT family N-acetyltransferase [Acidimicrobiia bacterium]
MILHRDPCPRHCPSSEAPTRSGSPPPPARTDPSIRLLAGRAGRRQRPRAWSPGPTSSFGYPPYLPDDDFRRLLTRPRALEAFVATTGSEIVGHVALHASRPNDAARLSGDALGCDPSSLGVVARLFTAPGSRRAGVGRLLLEAAADSAREHGLVPILDVWTELRDAIAMYEACGWRNLGRVTAELPDGRIMPEHVFTAP